MKQLVFLVLSFCLVAMGSEGASSGGGASLPAELTCEFPFQGGYYLYTIAAPPYDLHWKDGDGNIMKVAGAPGQQAIESSAYFLSLRRRTESSFTYSTSGTPRVTVKVSLDAEGTASQIAALSNLPLRGFTNVRYIQAEMSWQAELIDRLPGLCSFDFR
jgi:hypothetical protein